MDVKDGGYDQESENDASVQGQASVTSIKSLHMLASLLIRKL